MSTPFKIHFKNSKKRKNRKYFSQQNIYHKIRIVPALSLDEDDPPLGQAYWVTSSADCHYIFIIIYIYISLYIINLSFHRFVNDLKLSTIISKCFFVFKPG